MAGQRKTAWKECIKCKAKGKGFPEYSMKSNREVEVQHHHPSSNLLNELVLPKVLTKITLSTSRLPKPHFFGYYSNIFEERGPGSSVGIATDNGLDGPGSNPGRDEIFRPSRAALGPT